MVHGRGSTLEEEDIYVQQVKAKGEGKEMTPIIKSSKCVCSSSANKSHCIKPGIPNVHILNERIN